MITKISIENIKGFASPANEINLQLYPGRPNIVVAPNGYGKSSICRAFDCLCEQGIVLCDTDFHNNDTSLLPALKITYDDQEYTTDRMRNEVYNHFQCFCINSPLKATSVTKRIGGVRNYTINSLDIEKVELVKSIPLLKSLSYSSKDYKAAFGVNGKLLPNINADLCRIITFPYTEFDYFNGRGKQAIIRKIVDCLNSLTGSSETIIASVDDILFAELKTITEYAEITKFISSTFGSCSSLDVFLRFWILHHMYNADKRHFKQSVERNKFNYTKDNLNTSIKALDTTWKGIQAVEEGRKLVVKFPKAGNISYGQRDSLYLFASLERIKAHIDYTKPVIVIIDELFDYLDQVNMTIIQYFFSEFIAMCKRQVEIYPVIFTHLSPEYYHNYTFSKMNVQYLGDNRGIANTRTKQLLKARGQLPGDSPLYDDISKYLLHYHTGTISKEADFLAHGLKKKWGTGHGFAEYLVEECNKYFCDQSYDYYAISTAVRIRVEKMVYDLLQTADDKKEFLDTNGTKNKFAEASRKGVEIPDLYNLLGIIYNDAEHLPQNSDADKSIIYRLNNPMIKHMIRTLFGERVPITLSLFV